jgi:hypothetical protein
MTNEDTISDESIKLFIDHERIKEYEAEAARLEVTLDYYLAEFV